jgi:cytochrome c-type biogenesis protein CcmH
MKRVIVVIAALVALSAFTAFPANAQTRPIADSTLEARTTAVASTLRCPVCQGESIQDSPSELAQQMRSVVRDRLRSGESPDQVKAYFVSRYGEWILLEPKMTGLNVVLYVLPIVTVIGGLVLIVILVRRWTKPAEAGEG